ncbi:hypothetical protein GCM10009799_37070 [Nocardiopsis rhodophaea]|uniref:Uncharacterized protein n=1 Tax=Nocardiopsis rhodophaea TaxID=280238 RepID=A0ABP5ERY0_9ACTN
MDSHSIPQNQKMTPMATPRTAATTMSTVRHRKPVADAPIPEDVVDVVLGVSPGVNGVPT